jgi:photosystem II stability/assembly factor-like uncharacterized protein
MRLPRPGRLSTILLIVFAFFFALQPLTAQEISPSLYSSMRWRLIGPFRAGRVTCVAGVPEQPSIYYFGTPGGGIWKTTDAGQVWEPIFDEQRIASIGAIALAPSNPNIIYAGTGEQTRGNGVYKSTDAGATWTNIGLKETHIITSIVIDPHDPDLVLVGAAGDFASADNRGVFKTKDGGKTWQKVLFKDNDTRVMDLNMVPDTPKIVYAALLLLPNTPPTPGQAQPPRGQDATIYKSVDAGATWAPVEGKGLPTESMGRVGVAVVPGTHGKGLFAIAAQGLFHSEDGGATFTRSTTDPRILGNAYFSRVFVDPRNAQIVYVAQTSMYRSTDGGRTFEAFAGAPSGDDFHVLWINPLNTRNMIFGVDQGAIISADGGKTWSSWYNQPTGQFYHVITDNNFPYYVYAAQQDSGTAAVASRSDYGEITDRDWAPAGGFEFSYIAPDPLHPNYVYIGGWYGSVLRYDKTTGQVVHLFIRSPRYRTSGLAPLVFSPQDPHTLYVGAQYVLKTTDGGFNWQEISPDLTQRTEAQPPAGTAAPPAGGPQGVITTLAVSTVKEGEIWAGTGNGLVQVTRDGSTWQNVTPAGLPARTGVRSLEASRHDAAEAYAVIAKAQDLRPYIYRTRDFGQTWQLITAGLSDSAAAYAVREDPARKGLLYAGTANAVYVSFDDGDHWQTLQLNLPVTMITDLAVHGDDLAISTYGRALWILDDLTSLRQVEASIAQEDVHLFRPQQAIRVRWDMNQDTPLPIETPAGKNPPDGAIIDYYLKSAPSTDLKLTIYDSQNNVVREYSSVAPPADNMLANAPSYWFAPPVVLSKTSGLNRFAWDLRYPSPRTLAYSYYGNLLDYIEYTLPDHAIPGETPRQQPLGPLVVPGRYSVVLNVRGQTYRQELTVVLDPRVHVSPADLVQQLDAAKSILAQMSVTDDGYTQMVALRNAIAARQKILAAKPEAKEAADAAKALDDKAALVQNGTRTELGLGPLNRELARLAVMIESGDAHPATALQAAVDDYCGQLTKRLSQWRENNQAITPVNTLLQKYNLAPLPVASSIPADLSCGK